MLLPHLFLPTPWLLATFFQPENNRLRATVRSRPLSANCPCCGTTSSRIHSRYPRDPADLPAAGMVVTLQVECRRFYGDHNGCPQWTFGEPFPGFLDRSPRRTRRLGQVVEALGLALGGKTGARLARSWGIRIRPDTMRRALSRQVLKPVPEPRVLGVEDWAVRHGHTDGTLLVDLERHRPVDLWPDRKVETLADRFKAPRHRTDQPGPRGRLGGRRSGSRPSGPAGRQPLAPAEESTGSRGTVLNRHPRALQGTAEREAIASALPEPQSPPCTKPPNRVERDRRAHRDAAWPAIVPMFLRPQRHGRLEPPSYACSDSAGSTSFRAGWPRPNQRSCRSSRALHEAFGSTMMPLRPPFGPHGVKVRSRAKSTVSSPSNARGPGGPVSRSSGSGFSRRPEPTHLKTALISRAGMGCAFKTRDARPSPKDTRGHPGRQEESQGQRGPPPHQTPRKGQSASHHHEKCGRAKFQSRSTAVGSTSPKSNSPCSRRHVPVTARSR